MAVGFTAPIAGRLVDRRYPAGILGGVGLAVSSLGLVLVASQEAHADRVMDGDLRCWVRLLPIPILASVPRERAGSSSGILATAQLVGENPGCGPGRPDLRADER
jgi:DHA2 family multidrug resistance protein-like MFS transporter